MSEHVLWIDSPAAAGDRRLGGKFASLAEMWAAEIDIPLGFGITTDAYRSFMVSAGLVDKARETRRRALDADLGTIERLAAEMADAITTASIPADLEASIRAAYERLAERAGTADPAVAVRSSGESEDLAGASFAGQYDTFLWISGIDDVLDHVRHCWAGMFGSQVLTYRPAGGDALADFGICVGVQEMVPARSAGVMFTLDPLNGDRSKVVIESVWGLGEGVVSGAITPSRFVIDKVTGERVSVDVPGQTEMIALDPVTRATGTIPVPVERQALPTLDDDALATLLTLAKKIERFRGAPQDVEWAVSESGEVRILQVRPETIWSGKAADPVVRAPAANPVSQVLARFAGMGVARASGS